MTVDKAGNREEIEAAILELRGVDRVAVVLGPDGSIKEVHVGTRSNRPAKQIVRDIQGVVLTRFSRSFDHRVVSVFYEREPSGAANGTPAGNPGGSLPTSEAHPPASTMASAPRTADRIRFVSVNLYVSGPRAQAQVELRWKGITRLGTVTGTATRDNAHLLVASATVLALQAFLDEDWSLGVNGIQFVKLGVSEAVVVGLTLLAHRREKTLAGCCTVEQDVPQAVALATLAALNRVVGGLETREPIEYVLRPMSSREASEAKKQS